MGGTSSGIARMLTVFYHLTLPSLEDIASQLRHSFSLSIDRVSESLLIHFFWQMPPTCQICLSFRRQTFASVWLLGLWHQPWHENLQNSYKYRISVRLEHRIQITAIRSRNYIICSKPKQSLDLSNESNIYLNEMVLWNHWLKWGVICITWSSCLLLLSAQRYNSNGKFICYLYSYSFVNSRGQHCYFQMSSWGTICVYRPA